MPQFDSKEVPRKGNKIRIRLKDSVWLMGEIESVTPSMTFLTIRILGIKEDKNEEVERPTTLVDATDPLGPTVPVRKYGMDGRYNSRPSPSPNVSGAPDAPISPASIIEDDIPF